MDHLLSALTAFELAPSSALWRLSLTPELRDAFDTPPTLPSLTSGPSAAPSLGIRIGSIEWVGALHQLLAAPIPHSYPLTRP